MKSTFSYAAAVLGLAGAGTAGAAIITSTFTGPSGGMWNVAGNWSPTGVPNNGGGNTYNVIIDGSKATKAVTLNQTAAIDNLTVSAGDSLTVGNNLQLLVGGAGVGVGAVDNQGVINVASGGSHTYFRPNGGDITLTGGGEVVLSDAPNNWIYPNASGNLINQDNTIRGAGHIGQNNMGFTNGGTVIADGVNALEIDPNASGVANSGTLRAANGAQLLLSSGDYQNASGVIEALDLSFVLLQGAAVHGGTLQTSGSGEFRTLHGVLDGAVDAVDFTGRFNIQNNTQLLAIGTINNTGVIEINSAANHTYFRPNGGDLTLTGGGEVVLSDAPNNWIYPNGSGNLINQDNTIRGAGHIGQNNIAIVNDGLIVAEGVNTLIIDPDAGGVTNTGTLAAGSATADGLLQLDSGDFFNASGIVEATDGSVVFLAGAVVHGGTLQTSGSGEFRTLHGVLDGADDAIDFTGRFNIQNNTQLLAIGTINNTGVIEINSAANHTYFRPNGGELTLAGGGEVVLSDAANNWIYPNGSGNLINQDNTIRGAGHIGQNNMSITNSGTIRADGANLLEIDPDANGLANSGTLEVSGSGGMLIQPGPFTNTGNITINATRTLTRNSTFTQTAGTTNVAGTLSITGGAAQQMDLSGGVLKGTGNVAGRVQSNGGAVEPGASVGTLTMTTFTQTGGGRLRIEVAGTGAGQADKLVVTGTATLGGTLEIVPVNGYTPTVGDSFIILTAGTRAGTFQAVSDGYCVTYNATSATVSVVDTCSADLAGCDTNVNVDDLVAVILGWGPCPTVCPPGCVADANNDCNVDVDDLVAVILGWGACP